jgi:hypothetical protein
MSFGYDVSKVLSGRLTRIAIEKAALRLLQELSDARAKRHSVLLQSLLSAAICYYS